MWFRNKNIIVTQYRLNNWLDEPHVELRFHRDWYSINKGPGGGALAAARPLPTLLITYLHSSTEIMRSAWLFYNSLPRGWGLRSKDISRQALRSWRDVRPDSQLSSIIPTCRLVGRPLEYTHTGNYLCLLNRLCAPLLRTQFLQRSINHYITEHTTCRHVRRTKEKRENALPDSRKRQPGSLGTCLEGFIQRCFHKSKQNRA